MTGEQHSDGGQSYSHAIAAAGVIFLRCVQATLAVLGVMAFVGSLLAGQNVFAFLVVGIFTLVMLGLVGATELLMVRPVKRHFGGGADG